MKQSKSLIASFVVAAVLNLSSLASRPTLALNVAGTEPWPAAEQGTFSYGVDMDGVPFVQRADGTKGRFLSVSAKHFKLQISKEVVIGEVEFLRLAKYETLTTFSAAPGDSFGVRKTFLPRGGSGKMPDTVVTFELGKDKVAFKSQATQKQKSASLDLEKRLQSMFESLRANGPLRRLMEETGFFLSNAVTSKVFPVFGAAFFDEATAFDCASKAVACLLAVASYVGGVGTLIIACPETIGLGCVGALLLHPLLGAWVALACSDVISKCGVKKPGTESEDDLEMLWY